MARHTTPLVPLLLLQRKPASTPYASTSWLQAPVPLRWFRRSYCNVTLKVRLTRTHLGSSMVLLRRAVLAQPTYTNVARHALQKDRHTKHHSREPTRSTASAPLPTLQRERESTSYATRRWLHAAVAQATSRRNSCCYGDLMSHKQLLDGEIQPFWQT